MTQKWKTYFPFLFKLLIAFGIVIALIWANADGKLLRAIRSMHPGWVLLAAVFYGLHIFANAWRWHLLLRAQKIDCSLKEAYSLTMQSFFFSLVIPGGAIGGDLVRAAFLTRKVPGNQKFDGAFTILMDRFTGMIGIFMLALAILPFCWKALDMDSLMMKILIVILLGGSATGLIGAVIVFQHKLLDRIPLFQRFRRFADRLSKGMFTKMTDALDRYSNCRKEIMICILASIVFVNLDLGVVSFCVSRGLCPDWGAPMASLCAITIGNIAGLLPLTPSGVGARDLVVIPILENGGMNAETALAASLCITALILLFSLSGGLFFLFSKNAKK